MTEFLDQLPAPVLAGLLVVGVVVVAWIVARRWLVRLAVRAVTWLARQRWKMSLAQRIIVTVAIPAILIIAMGFIDIGRVSAGVGYYESRQRSRSTPTIRLYRRGSAMDLWWSWAITVAVSSGSALWLWKPEQKDPSP